MNNQRTKSCYENRSLFSDYYLTERLSFSQTLQEDCLEAFQQALDIYHTNKAALPGMNEAQTENTFIQLILEQVPGFSDLGLHPKDGKWLLSAQLKQRDPETVWDEWIKEDGNIVRSEFTDKEVRYWQQSFEVLDQFEHSSNFPGGKTRTTHEKLMKTKMPIFDDSANIEPLIELREELAEVKDKIEKTDWLIDQVVYRLYGLSEEEIEVVEGSV